MADRSAPPKLHKLCLALPEAELVEVEAWDNEPTYRVNNKVFVFAGPGGMTVKLPKDEAAAVIASDPRCSVAPYIGRHGWVQVDLKKAGAAEWDQFAEWVRTSYALVAPKRLAKLLDA